MSRTRTTGCWLLTLTPAYGVVAVVVLNSLLWTAQQYIALWPQNLSHFFSFSPPVIAYILINHHLFCFYFSSLQTSPHVSSKVLNHIIKSKQISPIDFLLFWAFIFLLLSWFPLLETIQSSDCFGGRTFKEIGSNMPWPEAPNLIPSR